ncbi:MAG: polysaccharide deacetylase family protein, partial [bacterium]
MFFREYPEKEPGRYCLHCWIPIGEGRSLGFRGKTFCSWRCLWHYHWCVMRITLLRRARKARVLFHRKKGWSAGLLAGSVLSLFLTIMFGILFNPFTNRPELPPVTEATVEVPLGLRYPFSLQMSHSPMERDRGAPPGSPAIEEARVREIKERIKISLIREYPPGPQRTVGVSGQAPEGSICALYLNDALYEATTCANGTFFFPRIALMSGKNFIEVLAHDLEGYVIPSNKVELYVGPNRLITERGMNITRGGFERPLVCLTFDGGASASCAPEILATLRKFEVPCTFFLTGDFIRNHSDLVKMMVEDGHEIGNHTDTHPHFARLTPQMRFETLPWVNKEFVQSQIKRAEKAFFEITGQRMAPFWRAPYGEHNL